jgi:hypothetical protein
MDLGSLPAGAVQLLAMGSPPQYQQDLREAGEDQILVEMEYLPHQRKPAGHLLLTASCHTRYEHELSC